MSRDYPKYHACECGGVKTKTPHSIWCPQHKDNLPHYTEKQKKNLIADLIDIIFDKKNWEKEKK